jgi:hypothetical protein
VGCKLNGCHVFLHGRLLIQDHHTFMVSFQAIASMFEGRGLSRLATFLCRRFPDQSQTAYDGCMTSMSNENAVAGRLTGNGVSH